MTLIGNFKFQIPNFNFISKRLLPFAFSLELSAFSFLLLAFSFLPFTSLHSQHSLLNKYSKYYFRNPLSIPLQLSGNFGDLRKDHFHMGLDIRTNQKENLSVYATADGYISRVKIERFGYGRVIYIKHSNGLTTLYAHLNNFFDTLNKYVKEKQYKEEKWEQDFELQPHQFPVKRSQLIAFSGNTGGSRGAHLHFEIRDKFTDTVNNISTIKERNLHPLLFDFGIKDNIAPRVDGLYWYDRRFSIYKTTANKIDFQKTKDTITTTDSIIQVGSNKISFGIQAEDKTSSSPFYFGIYSTQVFLDSVLQNSFELKTIPTSLQSYINGSIDYPYFINTKKIVQHISKVGKNILYDKLMQENDTLQNPYFIELKDTLAHQVTILVKDIAGNTSTINFLLKYNPLLQDNIDVKNDTKKSSNFFDSYYPDIKTDSSITKTVVTNSNSEFTVFDSVSVAIVQEKINGFPFASNVFIIGDISIPVQEPYQISILLDSIATNYPNNLLVVAKSATDYQSKKVTISAKTTKNNEDYLVANTTLDMFGVLQVLIDTIAPTITPINFSKSSLFNVEKQIIFKVVDDISEIKKFRAELDGKWLMFSRKDNYFIYNFDDNCSLGKHQLQITVEDEVGNITQQLFSFTKELPSINKSKKKLFVKKKKKVITKKKKSK